MKLDEQVVIVTGAGRGLGVDIAKAFAREGARVAINYRKSKDAAEALAASLGDRARAFQCDIRDADAVKGMVAEVVESLGAPTTVVHNALADFTFNGDARKKLDTIEWTDFNAHAETALGGALNLIHAVRPAMEKQGFGRIVHIGTNLFLSLIHI